MGQGYVGLSLACGAAAAGFHVTGIDVDKGRIESLAAGRLTVPGVREDIFKAGFATGRLEFRTDTEPISSSEVVAICVPTPVRDGTPDLSFVEQTCRDIAESLQPGSLVILESTTYPGTTEDLVQPLLEQSGLAAKRDFLLAYSPERIDPGSHDYDLRNTPRIVGGSSPEATGVASLFYAQFIDKVMSLSSCRAAELAKLLENTFRHVNIALVNEMSMLCREIDIDVWEVIDAAGTKPFGFMPFYPGPGVGGHCIPLDPMYLAWQIRRDAGHQFRILEQAQDINAQMPQYVAHRIGDVLNHGHKSIRKANILVLGVSYKEDISDIRESPALKVMSILHKKGARVRFHDPYIEEIVLNGRGIKRVELTTRAVSSADCVALLTAHKAYDLDWIAEHANTIFDARNAYGEARPRNVHFL